MIQLKSQKMSLDSIPTLRHVFQLPQRAATFSLSTTASEASFFGNSDAAVCVCVLASACDGTVIVVVLDVWPSVRVCFWFPGTDIPGEEGGRGMKLKFDRLHFHIKRVAGNHRHTGLSGGDITGKALPFKELW